MKTVLQQAMIDLDVLYANMFGLTDSQKKLVDEWLETYLPKEREQIEAAYDEGWQKCHNKNYDGSVKYYTATYDNK